jgi:hypothetical protein
MCAVFTDDQKMRALFLSGSFGRDFEDDYSDFDFVAVVADDATKAVSEKWRATLEAHEPVVYWKQFDRPITLVNAISERWLRCDLVVVGADAMARFTKEGLKPLIDRDGLYDGLTDTALFRGHDARRIDGIINEFIRVLGLSPVAIGRNETVLAGTGAGLLRSLLIDLLVEEQEQAQRGGALHLNRVLDAQDLKALDAIWREPKMNETISGAHIAYAQIFFPRAKALAAKAGVKWPTEFENATRAHLKETCGIVIE